MMKNVQDHSFLCVNHSHKNVKCPSQYFANTRIVPSFTMTEGYCVKCRTKREMKGTSSVTLKNGKPATKGTCPTCNYNYVPNR